MKSLIRDNLHAPGLCSAVNIRSAVRLSHNQPTTGIEQVTFPDWLSTTFSPADGQRGMADDIASGLFEADDLLARVQADLDAFYWQSHTFSHLSRDNLGLNDCRAEDAGERQTELKRTMLVVFCRQAYLFLSEVNKSSIFWGHDLTP